MSAPARPDRRPGEVTFRPVEPAELAECAAIWRESINDYTRRQGRLEIPPETGPLLRLYAHLQSTDPERFVAAVAPAPAEVGGEKMLGFGAAVRRERLWFLSMLFVLPSAQGQGLGRALLARILPARGNADGTPDDVVHSTATDSAQPISNALYATYGIVPRAPLLNLIGLPERRDAFGRLPAGLAAVSFERIEGDADGIGRLATIIDELDREVLSIAHPMDHAYVRAEGRRGFLYTGPDGSALGYGYAGESGRVGPIATRDPDLLGPILGHLTEAIQPRGAFAVWLAGDADRAIASALRAGFRLDDYPVLLCWDRPFVDLARYVPISPGLP